MAEEKIDALLELLKQRKFTQVYDELKEMRPEDIAPLFEQIDMQDAVKLFRLLPKSLAADTFVEMDSEHQQKLIEAFSDTELKAMLDEMHVDDTVDIIEEMPANVVRRILRQSDAQTRKNINEILNYPSDSAGSIMTVEYVDLHRGMTVSKALDHIKKTGLDKETVYTCYVIDRDRHLEGIVTVLQMLLADWNEPVENLMDTNVISINTLQDREEAANMLNKYGFMALPVVDNENRLVGIVTFDDAIDVLTEEATEDIEKMAAIVPSDKPYLKTSVFEIFRKRIPWLLLLMISATFTGSIIASFEDRLAVCTALVSFIPMLMDTGGNAGGQTSVTIIRGLALGEITFPDFFRVLWRELRVALLCGVTLAVCNFGKILLVDRMLMHNAGITLLVDLCICLTLVCAVLLAKLVGCILPMAAKKVGFDPAVMASPFITTIVDALTLLVYFGLAQWLLHI